MSNSTISGMQPASLPLGDEAIPCVQDGANVQAPAAAFGIPVLGDAAPTALAQFQTWIDTSTAPPTLRMYVGSNWVALYTVDGDGTLALARPLGLSSDDRLTGALKFKSVIDCSVSPNYPPADLGDFYVVGVAGKIGGAAGIGVQAGDTLLCLANGTPSDIQANVGASWTIGQNNIVGAVTGPASSTGGDFAQFADATGKVVQDNGLVLDTDYSMAASSDTHIPSQNAVKIYIADALARYNTAVVYQGPIACSGNPNYPAGVGGDLYLILSAGKIGGASGINVEIGDMILCHTVVPSGNQATVGWAWNVIQNNIDGAVTGPASSTSGHFAQFADASGKVIQDSSLILDTDPALAASLDTRIPSQHAVKVYVGNQLGSALFYRGAMSCSSSPNYPTGIVGDFYVVSAAGKIGGASGINVEIGDTLLCVAANAGGTQASVGSSWTIGQGNIDGAVTGPSSATSNGFALFNGTTGKIVKDSLATFDTDATMAANSDNRIPSQKAVKSYASGNVGPNLFVNSAFDIWQENTSYTLGTLVPKTHVADFWKAGAEATTKVVSRITGLQGSPYGVKMLRSSGATSTNASHLTQQFEARDCTYLSGKTVTISFDFAIGANYSPVTGPFVEVFYGTGSEEDLAMNSTPPFFSTGGGNLYSSDLSSQVAAYGSSARLSATLTLPTATEFAIGIGSGVYVGTAGADDSFVISNVKLEIGSAATPFRRPDMRDELLRCQWRYQKSFAQATVPTQNAGAGTGEFLFRRAGSGTAAEGSLIRFRRTMRGAPAITLGNPSAANAQVRNESGTAADCASSTADNASENGFRVTCTGNSGGSAGDWLGVHWIADKRL